MVIRAAAYFWRGEPLPRSDEAVRQKSLVDDLNLIQLQLDGRFPAEHGYDDADFVLFDVDQIDDANEAGQRAIRHTYIVALGIGHHDLVLFHAELPHLIILTST